MRESESMSNETTTTEPRIYVASLSDYNAGILHGVWITCDDADEMHEAVTEMLAASPTTARYGDPAEEWAIHDHEGLEGIRLGEFEDFETVATHARMVAEHGKAWALWIDYEGGDPDEDAFAEAYCGEWASAADYAQVLAEDCGDLSMREPDPYHRDRGAITDRWPFTCIDWDKAARELSFDGYSFHETGWREVHVFRSY